MVWGLDFILSAMGSCWRSLSGEVITDLRYILKGLYGFFGETTSPWSEMFS